MEEYCMYFPFLELPGWVKDPVLSRRRFIQCFPLGELAKIKDF